MHPPDYPERPTPNPHAHPTPRVPLSRVRVPLSRTRQATPERPTHRPENTDTRWPPGLASGSAGLALRRAGLAGLGQDLDCLVLGQGVEEALGVLGAEVDAAV
ncbi:hypothetical protein GCM10010174_79940 [Kutzneria viridogrisea]